MSQITKIGSEFTTIVQPEISTDFSPVRTNFTTIQAQLSALIAIDATLRARDTASANKEQQ